jgi:hypothetical protein
LKPATPELCLPALRTEVIHQVENKHFSESVTAIRVGEMKLIVGNPGDARMLRWLA